MGKREFTVLLVLAMCYAALAEAVAGYEGEKTEEGGERGRGVRDRGIFLLPETKHVVKTDAGDMRLVRGFGGTLVQRRMHVGFITMEPKSLFVPQYLDSNLILFVRRGEAKVGSIYKDRLVESNLRSGDVYRIGAGSAFYLVNTAEGQKLHIIFSVDKSDEIGWGTFQSFFIGGGTYPTSVLSGFDSVTLSTAFNVSESELAEIMTRQMAGPIMYLSDSAPSTRFFQMNREEKVRHLKKVVRFQSGESTKEEEKPTWSFRKILKSVFSNEPEGENIGKKKSLDSYNIYDRKPDFKNNYGWSIALEESDYPPLERSGVGIYLVNLIAGSMMAPHVNPTATEYGIVLSGAGRIQVVFPNGSLAMDARVSEGDVFFIPRYFPFCQIASRTGPFEFFGFTTASQKNRPQFLIGKNSLMDLMRGPEFAAAYDVSEDRLGEIIDAQEESVILPSATVAPSDEATLEERETERVIRSLGSEMVMGFD
ncbi:hypothetical protein NMG60_11033870 [Bertholletia excelsa]